MEIKDFNSDVWGPQYWFFMHTVGYSYPKKPNETTRRKYYDLIMNMPLFIPDPEIGKTFSNMLDKYPVTPYLGNKVDFQKWLHFIHNKVNKKIGKPQISIQQAYNDYCYHYKPTYVKISESFNISKHYIYAIFIILITIFIYMNGI
jgi:hypothetical protein